MEIKSKNIVIFGFIVILVIFSLVFVEIPSSNKKETPVFLGSYDFDNDTVLDGYIRVSLPSFYEFEDINDFEIFVGENQQKIIFKESCVDFWSPACIYNNENPCPIRYTVRCVLKNMPLNEQTPVLLKHKRKSWPIKKVNTEPILTRFVKASDLNVVVDNTGKLQIRSKHNSNYPSIISSEKTELCFDIGVFSKENEKLKLEEALSSYKTLYYQENKDFVLTNKAYLGKTILLSHFEKICQAVNPKNNVISHQKILLKIDEQGNYEILERRLI